MGSSESKPDQSFYEKVTHFINPYYLSKTDAGELYLQKSDAGDIYLKQDNAGELYLTKDDANKIYIQSDLANNTFITKDDGKRIYLAQDDAQNIYLSQTNFNSAFENIQATNKATLDLFTQKFTEVNTRIDNLANIYQQKGDYITLDKFNTHDQDLNTRFQPKGDYVIRPIYDSYTKDQDARLDSLNKSLGNYLTFNQYNDDKKMTNTRLDTIDKNFINYLTQTQASKDYVNSSQYNIDNKTTNTRLDNIDKNFINYLTQTQASKDYVNSSQYNIDNKTTNTRLDNIDKTFNNYLTMTQASRDYVTSDQYNNDKITNNTRFFNVDNSLQDLDKRFSNYLTLDDFNKRDFLPTNDFNAFTKGLEERLTNQYMTRDEYMTHVEELNSNLSQIYQPKGNYITMQEADDKYLKFSEYQQLQDELDSIKNQIDYKVMSEPIPTIEGYYNIKEGNQQYSSFIKIVKSNIDGQFIIESNIITKVKNEEGAYSILTPPDMRLIRTTLKLDGYVVFAISINGVRQRDKYFVFKFNSNQSGYDSMNMANSSSKSLFEINKDISATLFATLDEDMITKLENQLQVKFTKMDQEQFFRFSQPVNEVSQPSNEVAQPSNEVSQPSIMQRKPVVDSGYPDGVKGDLKSGWYDIIGQGVPNDYCRYVGDGAGFFACVLSTDGQQYTQEYNGRKVDEIARTAMKDECANTSDGNVSIDCYKAIWENAGCPNMDTASQNYNWARGQTKASLINDSQSWATMTDNNHRQGCYGYDQASWPKSYIRFSRRN